MTNNPLEFRAGVVAPMECLKEGWAMIKDHYWLFLGITIVGMLIGSAFAIVLLGPMMCGVYLCLLQHQRGEKIEFGMLFKGFDYFLPGFVAQLIKSIPVFVVMVPFYVVMIGMMVANMPRRGEPDQGFMFTVFGFEIFFFLILMIVGLLVEIFCLFAFPLIVDRKLSGLEAIKLSLRASRANLGGVIGLLLLNALFGSLALLACIVGVYFYLPVSFAAHTVAYRRVFPDIGDMGMYPPSPPPPGNWAA